MMMKNCSKYITVFTALILSAIQLYGQENYAKNIKKEIFDDKMFITYDIEESGDARFFDVTLVLIYNDKPIDTEFAYGKLGSGISPGKEHTILWYYTNDIDGDANAVNVRVIAFKQSEPRASFQVDIGNNGFAPCEVSFINSSKDAHEYKWNFGDIASGDKNLSFEENPKHNYKKGGEYIITLVATNIKLEMADTSFYTVSLKEHPPTIADFEYTVSYSKEQFDVSFIDNSTNADSYSWDFGDPESGNRKNSSSASNPKHKYKLPGSFLVKLIASNSSTNLRDTVSKELELKPPEKPIPNFIVSLSSESAPTIAIFSNTSKNSTGYSWNFGDPASESNNKSSEANPTHVYRNPGTYVVTLTSSDDQTGLSGTITKDIIINEAPKPPSAGFTIDNNNSIPPVTITFTNTSRNADAFQWNFGDPSSGDNNTSSLENPKHNYSEPGRYRVTLVSQNSKLEGSDEFTDYVIIAEPAKPPVAAFTIEGNNMPAPAEVTFKNASLNADDYSWDFGDPSSGDKNTSSLKDPSHTYTSAGKYKVVLVCTNLSSGESNSLVEYLNVEEQILPPDARFTVQTGSLTAPATVGVSNLSSNADSYTWDFGDPGSGDQNISTLENPTHTYSKAGRYKIVLVCKSIRSDEISTHHEYVTISQPAIVPLADFDFEPKELFAPATVYFNNRSRKADTFNWNFGDPASGSNNTSSEAGPTHVFHEVGQFKVTLSVKNASSGEESEVTKTIVINKPIPPPEAGFNFIFNTDDPLMVSLSNTSTGGDQYQWDFGDPESPNNRSNEANPVHKFTRKGSYNVSLTVSSSATGKSDMTSRIIIVGSEEMAFDHSIGTEEMDEIARSLLQVSSEEILVLVSNGELGSSLVIINDKGDISREIELGSQIYDIDKSRDEESFVLAGFQKPDNLTIHTLSSSLEIVDTIFTNGITNVRPEFSLPKVAIANNREVGVVGNLVIADIPRDFWFQKLDSEGSLVRPPGAKTFKYQGLMLANELIPSNRNGFVITGYWQADTSQLKRLLLASVDSSGKTSFNRIATRSNSIGCDIVSSHTGGYAILSTDQNSVESEMYDLVLTTVAEDGGPDPYFVVKSNDLLIGDVNKFPPCIIRADHGYIIASYTFNGTDYDIDIFWIDPLGSMVVKQSSIKRPGDQFVTDILELDDGNLIIVGAEKNNNQYDALILGIGPSGSVNK